MQQSSILTKAKPPCTFLWNYSWPFFVILVPHGVPAAQAGILHPKVGLRASHSYRLERTGRGLRTGHSVELALLLQRMQIMVSTSAARFGDFSPFGLLFEPFGDKNFALATWQFGYFFVNLSGSLVSTEFLVWQEILQRGSELRNPLDNTRIFTMSGIRRPRFESHSKVQYRSLGVRNNLWLFQYLQAPHTSKKQSLSLSKTPIQGFERRGYPQQGRWSKKSGVKFPKFKARDHFLALSNKKSVTFKICEFQSW